MTDTTVCTWEADPACLGTKWDELPEAVQDRSLMLATSSLQMLTLNRVGTCPITIRPQPAPPCPCWSPLQAPGGPARALADRGWGQYACGVCQRPVAPLSEIDLPGPVGYVASIKVDGAELDLTSGDWELDDGHLVVWRGTGPSPIPATQNLALPDSAVGTWSITYSKSYPIGADAKIAVAYLAMEFAQACVPKGKCSLPRGVTNVVRNGVSFTVSAGLFPNGLTNIEVVDQFIMKWVPPGSPNRSATVFDPSKIGQAPRLTNMLRTRP